MNATIDYKQAFAKAPFLCHQEIYLQKCSLDLISSELALREYLERLLELLSATPYGNCYIVDFGKESKQRGLSLFQLLDKGHVAIHCSYLDKSCFISIACNQELKSSQLREQACLYFAAESIC